MNLNYQELRDGKHIPYLHGNGFIQLWLDDEGNKRLHVFPSKKLQAQKVNTSIHNHIFGFNSKVIRGHIINRVFSVFHDNNGDHQIYEATQTEGRDTKLLPIENGIVRVKQKYLLMMYSGNEYEQSPFEYHETKWGEGILSATIMTKTFIVPGYKPRVLCEIDKKPDNDFSRHGYDTEILWSWIKQALSDDKI